MSAVKWFSASEHGSTRLLRCSASGHHCAPRIDLCVRPDDLAAAVVGFQRRYDYDFVKVTPASSFSVADWGVRDEWRGNDNSFEKHDRNRDGVAAAFVFALLYAPFLYGLEVPLGAVPNVVAHIRFNGPLFRGIAALSSPSTTSTKRWRGSAPSASRSRCTSSAATGARWSTSSPPRRREGPPSTRR